MTIARLAVLCCDSCKARTELLGDNASARVQASRQGWKFMIYQGLDVPGDRKLRSRQWDSCPDCELPEPAEVVKVLRAEIEDEAARRAREAEIRAASGR
jgi:heme exporter protein D